MKRQALSIFATLGLIFILSAAGGYAQDSVVAHVPFAFSVGSKALPAGNYSLIQLSQTKWAVRNNDGGPSALTVVSLGGLNPTEDQGKLVFKHYGDHYFLHQISKEGITVNVPPSRLERELAHNGVSPGRTTVAAGQ